MSENYVIGNVISVDGLRISILVNGVSDVETFHFDGIFYPGISIGGYLGIIRGANKTIVRIEKEFLEDKFKDTKNQEYLKDRFERILEVSIIGNLSKDRFKFGIKKFPKIYNEAVLLTAHEVQMILQNNSRTSANIIYVGKSLVENIPISLSWNEIFNTHIGVFGNTGSGKSNTLAKLYTELFKLEGTSIQNDFNRKSKFFILDFNGEYVNKGVLRNKKTVINLNTEKVNSDKIPLSPATFWEIETLSILYSATEKTQRPFLQKAVGYFLDEKKHISSENIINGMGSAFSNIFNQNNNKDTLNLLNKCMEILDYRSDCVYTDESSNEVEMEWLEYLWHSKNQTYYLNRDFINEKTKDFISSKRAEFEKLLRTDSLNKRICALTVTEKLRIIVNCHLIYCLSFGKANFEHINPLIQRIEARSKAIEKTISIDEKEHTWGVLNIISLRNCNAETKKMIPLLIAKQLYNEHKSFLSDKNKITGTVNLIIDEAHNILSGQSIREEESWKDYRLEVFEEIIKEGRKFGFFITLASQRPYDISPTIVSQLHNYFIHRLVNEQDLKMIGNTVNSLDSVSKSRIPNLAPGQCVITGTSFEMPLLIQIEKLSKEESPASENADLVELWTVAEDNMQDIDN